MLVGERSAVLVLLLASCAREDDAAVVVAAPDAGAPVGADATAPVDAGACSGIECSKIKLAFRHVFAGETDRGERTLSYAWRSFGTNVDGIVSNYTKRDECKPPEGAFYAPPDGDEGIDNVWGQSIVPLLAPWDATPTKSANAAIERGGRTPVLVLGAISGGIVESTLEAWFSFVEASPTTPAWNGTDVRMLAAAYAPVVSYRAGKFANGIFDSGPAEGAVPLELALGTQSIVLPVRGLRVRFELRPDNSSSAGVLSGIVSVADMTLAAIVHVARTKPEVCSGQQLEGLRAAIRQAADVLADGARDPTRTCDAISFGMGFDAAPIELRGVAAPIAVPPTICP